jgi:hypothetical protein
MKDSKKDRFKGLSMRRFAFFFGATGGVYYIYAGDLAGTLCFGAISLIALISKARSRKKARNSDN